MGGQTGAFGARPLSLQMRLAAGIFFTQRLQRGVRGGGKVFFALLLSDTALTFTAGSDTAPTTKLFPHPNKLRQKLKTENKSHVKGI